MIKLIKLPIKRSTFITKIWGVVVFYGLEELVLRPYVEVPEEPYAVLLGTPPGWVKVATCKACAWFPKASIQFYKGIVHIR